MVSAPKLVPVLLLLAFVLAGCTSGGGGGAGTDGGPGTDAPQVEATSTTGGIRGVVVDDAVRPIKGALVQVDTTSKNVTTGEDGTFVFSGLEPGTYFVSVSHPLYKSAQASAEVVAGDSSPKVTKILLVRSVFASPYMATVQFDGYIVCSANAVLPLVGGILSEECGEGVGVPGVGRVGGQSNNNVEFDFYVDGPFVKSMVVEQVWEATSDAGRALYSPIATEWVCDPICSGHTFAEIEGESPTYQYIDNATLEPLNLSSAAPVSIFTWASPSTTPIGVTLNQQYSEYVTMFYYLPAPEGWSLVNGDPNPFA